MGFLIAVLVLVYLLACLFLIFVVLLQSGKGGGLSGLFGGGGALSETLGASGAEKTLNKWTTYATITFFVIALLLTVFASRQASRSILESEFPQETPGQVAATPTSVTTVETSPGLSQRSSAVELGSPKEGSSESGAAAPAAPSSESGTEPAATK